MAAIETMELFGRAEVKVFAQRPSTIGQLLTDTAARYGEKPAVVTEQQTLNYRELDEQSTTLAANLQQRDIQVGDRVACAARSENSGLPAARKTTIVPCVSVPPCA